MQSERPPFPVIVTDATGGIVQAGGGFLTYNPACWEDKVFEVSFRNFDKSGDWWEECDCQISDYAASAKAVRLYVASVAGATEAGDTGDGSEDNPFSCFLSAIRKLREMFHGIDNERTVLAAYTGCYCGEQREAVAQIVVTGTVDCAVYTAIGLAGRFHRLIITGNGYTQFNIRDHCDLMNLAHKTNIQNCTITSQAEEFHGGDGKVSVFENCKIYSPVGMPDHCGSTGDCYTFLYQSELHEVLGEDAEEFGWWQIQAGFLRESTIHTVSFWSYDERTEEYEPGTHDVYVYASDPCSGIIRGDTSHTNVEISCCQ